VILLAAVVVGTRLGVKESLWKLKQEYRVEFSDEKVIQERHGAAIVEIPLDQIVSLRQNRGGWLVIRGGEPERQVVIPSEITGFEDLRRRLSTHQKISPVKVSFSPWLFLPSASLILACFFLLTSGIAG
jgi:hypothetical protein